MIALAQSDLFFSSIKFVYFVFKSKYHNLVFLIFFECFRFEVFFLFGLADIESCERGDVRREKNRLIVCNNVKNISNVIFPRNENIDGKVCDWINLKIVECCVFFKIVSSFLKPFSFKGNT